MKIKKWSWWKSNFFLKIPTIMTPIKYSIFNQKIIPSKGKILIFGSPIIHPAIDYTKKKAGHQGLLFYGYQPLGSWLNLTFTFYNFSLNLLTMSFSKSN